MPDEYIEELLNQIGPWGEVIAMDEIQRKSGMLRTPKNDRGRLVSLKPREAFERIADLLSNEIRCPHEHEEAVGKTPMGSFTMTTFRCTRCGHERNDD